MSGIRARLNPGAFCPNGNVRQCVFLRHDLYFNESYLSWIYAFAMYSLNLAATQMTRKMVKSWCFLSKRKRQAVRIFT